MMPSNCKISSDLSDKMFCRGWTNYDKMFYRGWITSKAVSNRSRRMWQRSNSSFMKP